MNTAFIIGITGQDGAYLARLLLAKGYRVVGGFHKHHRGFQRLANLGIKERIELIEIDLRDRSRLTNIISHCKPNEIYNLAAQSFVHQSFIQPQDTRNITGISIDNVLQAIYNINKDIRFYQASSSEMFGLTNNFPQNELSSFHPVSPYGMAKLYAHRKTVNFRELHKVFAVAGILFNHESPLRDERFVTKKICRSVARIIKWASRLYGNWSTRCEA